MKKLILLSFILLSFAAFSQHGIAWHEIHRVWYINSAGYPSDDTQLDKLYFRLHDFKLDLSKHEHFTMTFRADSVVTGKYTVDKHGLTMTFIVNGESTTFAFLEVNKDILAMQCEENRTWAFFLNLTSHN